MSAVRLNDAGPGLELFVAGLECGLKGEEGGVGVVFGREGERVRLVVG